MFSLGVYVCYWLNKKNYEVIESSSVSGTKMRRLRFEYNGPYIEIKQNKAFDRCLLDVSCSELQDIVPFLHERLL